jgi:hypothetical protein
MTSIGMGIVPEGRGPRSECQILQKSPSSVHHFTHGEGIAPQKYIPVLPSNCNTPTFEEFRVSMYLDVIRRGLPFSEGDESVGPGRSSVGKHTNTL